MYSIFYQKQYLKIFHVVGFLFTILVFCEAQLSIRDSIINLQNKPIFTAKNIILPSTLIAYGTIGLFSAEIQNSNKNIRSEFSKFNASKYNIDDYIQFIAPCTVTILDLFGNRSKHSFWQRVALQSLTFGIMGTTVFGLKEITKIQRPDLSSKNSFPSGHTATAFAGAEYLWQEYKHKSVWYCSGYILASSVAFMRLYNDRHWFTDVAAGAGIGILSTKLSYYFISKYNGKTAKSKIKKENLVY